MSDDTTRNRSESDSGYVTDPELLKRLNEGDSSLRLTPVTDPELLKQLNDLSAQESQRVDGDIFDQVAAENPELIAEIRQKALDAEALRVKEANAELLGKIGIGVILLGLCSLAWWKRGLFWKRLAWGSPRSGVAINLEGSDRSKRLRGIRKKVLGCGLLVGVVVVFNTVSGTSQPSAWTLVVLALGALVLWWNRRSLTTQRLLAIYVGWAFLQVVLLSVSNGGFGAEGHYRRMARLSFYPLNRSESEINFFGRLRFHPGVNAYDYLEFVVYLGLPLVVWWVARLWRSGKPDVS